jgi:hypothetical protein
MIFFTQLIANSERRMQLFGIVFYLMLGLLGQSQTVPTWQTGANNQSDASGSGTSYSVAKPSNIVAGDLVILFLTQQRASSTATTSSFTPTAGDGFTLIRAQNAGNNDRTSISVYYKIATSSEPVNYTGTIAQFTNAPNWKAVVNRVTGHDPFAPIGAANGADGNSTTTISIPQISTAINNSLLVAMRSVRTAVAGSTVPTGMTESWIFAGSGTGSSGVPAIHAARQTIATAAATGTRAFTWTATAANERIAGVMFAINPGPTATTNLPCWSRISQRYWVATRNATGGKVQNGDVVTVAAVININPQNTSGGGSNTWVGVCNTGTGSTTTLLNFSFQQSVPTNTTYVSGTLKGLTARDLVYSGGSTDNVANLTGNFTDAQDVGDDAFISGNMVVFNLGTGATNSSGGTLASSALPRQSGFIYQAVFNVTVNAANGSTVNLGGGKIYYRNTAGGALYEYTLPDMFVQVAENISTDIPIDTANLITAAERGTFGTLKTAKFGDPIGAVVPGFTFIRRTEVYDNEYTIVAQTSVDTRAEAPANVVGTAPTAPNLTASPTNSATDVVFYQAATSPAIQGGWDVIADHTRATNTALGNPLFNAAELATGKGYMLMVNGSYAPATVFQATSNGLNPNTYYKISFWIRNICNNCHNNTGITGSGATDGERSNPGVLPNVAFKIDGKIAYTTGQIPYDNPTGVFNNTASRNTWKKREFIYLNQSAGNTIDLELINFAPGGGGNDFVVDDIEIKRVLPLVTYNEVCLAAGYTGTLTGNVNSTQIPQNFSWYQWQISDNGGANWTNVTPATEAVAPLNPQNYSVDYAITNAPNGRRYRIISAANQVDLGNNAFIAGIAVVTVDNCCVTYRIAPEHTGIWSRPENWEFYNPVTENNIWLPATSTPPQGSRVEIRTVFTQDVNFTVEQCPLILNNNGLSKLTINPQITLGFEGGEDGNAYFNSRPVIVKSTAAGTGAIGKMFDDGPNPGEFSKTLGDDNVTLERYIPGNKRRWNLLTFGVTSATASIRDGWGGGSRGRVSNSANYNAGRPLGNPSPTKPNNVPFPTPGDYVAEDATIITGHGHSLASTANGQGFDWWPELIIPKGATFWVTPTKSVVAGRLVTTPSSIRPYRPGEESTFDTSRGVGWVSQPSLNTNYNGLGVSIVNAKLDDAEQGYMLYTRGDRQVLENWFNSTTLRPTGQIKKMDIQVTLNPDPALTVFGNPYPSPIDFEELSTTNSALMENRFYYWDSNIPGTQGNGGWRTVTQLSPGNWQAVPFVNILPSLPPVPPTLTSKVQFISSSQAILLESKSLNSVDITVNEAMKVDITTVNVTPFEVEPSTTLKPGVLFANFNTRNDANELSLMDGVAVLMAFGFKAETTDESDIKKIYNFTDAETSISLARNGLRLGVEAYPEPETEAIFYLYTKGLEKRNYALTFHAMDLQRDGREIFLKDNFMGTLNPISDMKDSQYDFAGTDDALSLQPNRFEIVFKQSTILPVTFTRLQAVEQDKNIKVSWSLAAEKNVSHYEVEHSRNGTDFSKAVQVAANNTSPASYDWLHIQPGAGNHFYRVRGVDNDGKFNTSHIVKVTLGSNKPAFTAFPTVVPNTRQVALQINSMKAGDYILQVTDMSGRVIQSQKLKLDNGAYAQILQLPPALQSGRYNIRLAGESGSFLQVIVKD